MREDFPERPEMEDMRRVVELYARGHLPPDVLTRETQRFAFAVNVVAPVRRWVAALRVRREATRDTTQSHDVEATIHRAAR
jgi:hypothetical protein